MFIRSALLNLGWVVSLCRAAELVTWTQTTRDMADALAEKDSIPLAPIPDLPLADLSILIDESLSYQTIVGIGSSLEASTAFNMMRLAEPDRKTLLSQLFDPKEGIGFNLMRITIGTSDFCPLPYYSYDDLEENETDVNLDKFSIARDKDYIIPLVGQAIEASKSSETLPADQLQFFASPWSPPGWMKTSGVLEGGGLKSEYLEVYSAYLGKFLDAYAEEGIPIRAITPQNEPLSSQTYPSVFFPPNEEATLIKNYLGPLMRERGTEIWCFDHNWNTPYYPLHIYNDTEAAQFVSGSAWHGYRGRPSSMTEVHNEYPEKDIYFSERSTYGIKGAHEIVAIFRNWARTYSAWVTMLDTNLEPNAGPFNPDPTMVQLNATSLEIIYNLEYFMYGHFSKYIRRGALRISSETLVGAAQRSLEASNGLVELPTFSHVAFVNDPSVSGRADVVVVAVNTGDKVTAQFQYKGVGFNVDLAAHSISTFSWEQAQL